MQELSLNILDIAENSTRAGATMVEISVIEDPETDVLVITIKDNGSGMDKKLLDKVINPFTTTRTTRKVGLGIPLFKEVAEMAGGHFSIVSAPGSGTTVEAFFSYSHINRMPIGDIATTLSTLIQCHDDTDFIYLHRYKTHNFRLDTRELRETLGGVPLSQPEVVLWVREYVNENLYEIYLEG